MFFSAESALVTWHSALLKLLAKEIHAIEVQEWGVEDHTVKPIKYSPMARDQTAGVLRLCATFEHRFAKIAEDA